MNKVIITLGSDLLDGPGIKKISISGGNMHSNHGADGCDNPWTSWPSIILDRDVAIQLFSNVLSQLKLAPWDKSELFNEPHYI